jgi:Ca-activated chloride channel family protein
MFRIEQPEALLLLLLLPVLWFLVRESLRATQRKISSLGNDQAIALMIPGFNLQQLTRRQYVLLATFALLILSLANPQLGLEKEEVETKSADVFIALDVSKSMLAEDVQPNRIARARRLGSNLISALRTERIGLISFAGNAYLHMPLTSDIRAARTFLESMDPSAVSTQGTSIAGALDLAARSFDAQAKTHPVLVMITDGEDHEGEIDLAIQKIKDRGIYVFVVGIGSEGGAYIPEKRVSGDGFVRDENGALVKSALNAELLSGLADELNGSYFSYANERALINAIDSRIEMLDKIALERRSFSTYRSFFQYFLLGAVLCIAWVFGSPNRRKNEL